VQTNDVLRRLRYALDLRDAELADAINHTGDSVSPGQVRMLLLSDEDENQVECSESRLERALDGLIVARRGPRDPSKPAPVSDPNGLTNNAILKKLRIAMAYREADMLGVIEAGGLTLSSSELSALFRKPENKHFRRVGDQLLRAFFKGMALRERGAQTDTE
jgi:uncharacterized protein YehS (DUF1456 family)